MNQDHQQEIEGLRTLINQSNEQRKTAVTQLDATIDGLRGRTFRDNDLPNMDGIIGELQGVRQLIAPVDAASGAPNRTTTDANGESTIAGTTTTGTPINRSTPEPENATTLDSQSSTSTSQTGASE